MFCLVLRVYYSDASEDDNEYEEEYDYYSGDGEVNPDLISDTVSIFVFISVSLKGTVLEYFKSS